MSGRSTRQKALRKIDNAVGNVEKAMQHLHEVGETYAGHHDDQTNGIAQCIIALKMCADLITKTKEVF